MRHPFMEAIAAGLGSRGVATLRFQFPYMEAGRRRPDAPSVAMRAVRAAVTAARRRARGVPVFAGGKSFGGRMTSLAAAAAGLEHTSGLVLLGFPLHRPGGIDRARAQHLAEVRLPMLFVQGTRDPLADIATMTAVVRGLGSGAALHVVEQGDHGFAIPKRSGRDPREVLERVCDVVAQWMRLRRSGGTSQR
jgi:predicted alpha/beta-hydrolase family hydrolase